MNIRVGHLSTLYHTSMLMMAKEVLLEGFPAQIDWQLYGTGPDIIDAFLSGSLDMAYVGLPPAIIGISRGLRLRCVAGGHIEGTVIASHADAPAYPDEDNLGRILSKSKDIGVPGRGSIHDLILKDVIEEYGLNVNVHNLPWADMVLEEFIKGNVDTVVGTPALAQAVRQFGGGKIIYPPNLLWPENPSYGIVVTEDFLVSGRALIALFLAIHEKAAKILRENKEEASKDIAGFMKVIDERFVSGTLAISPKYCACLTEGYVDCAMRLSGRLKELGYMERAVSPEEVFDRSIIKEIHKEPCHY
jgi:NitT/TauT family transport system substrate-binding protein